jgi:spore germination protein YaaH
MNNTFKIITIVAILSTLSLALLDSGIEPITPPNRNNDELDSEKEVRGITSYLNEHDISPAEKVEISSEISKQAENVSSSVPVEISIHQIEDALHLDASLPTQNIDKSLSSATPSVVPLNVNNDREVLGFLPYWYWGSSTNNDLQYDKLSTIAYFGLETNSNGSWDTSYSGYTNFYSSNFSDMLSKAHANNVKVVVVVKEFDAASIRNIVQNTGGAGDTLISNIKSVVQSRGLDGVNIDFEYLGSVDDPLRASFASWHDNLADQMHAINSNYHVSTDVYASSALNYRIYDVDALGDTSLDYIMVMAYDFFTLSSTVAGPTSPLYGSQYWYTVSQAMTDIMAQAPGSKLIMGIPYYGLEFPVSSTTYNATRDSGRSVYYSTYKGVVAPSEDTWHNGSTLRWDNTDKVRWYVYRYPNMTTDPLWQGYYDDEVSLQSKYEFVRSKGIGGIGIWTLGNDTGYDELWNVLQNNFQSGEFLLSFKSSVSEGRKAQVLAENSLEVVRIGNYNVYTVRPTVGISKSKIDALKKYKNDISSVGFTQPDNDGYKIIEP